MIGNHVYIIGGAIVGSQHKWKEFYKLVLESQKITLNNNIVDDDRGILSCAITNARSLQPKLSGERKMVRFVSLLQE